MFVGIYRGILIPGFLGWCRIVVLGFLLSWNDWVKLVAFCFRHCQAGRAGNVGPSEARVSSRIESIRSQVSEPFPEVATDSMETHQLTTFDLGEFQ